MAGNENQLKQNQKQDNIDELGTVIETKDALEFVWEHIEMSTYVNS